MNIDLKLEVNGGYLGTFGSFTITNKEVNVSYSGNLYDYNQIQFLSKSGGIVQWLSDFMQFENHEAIYIAEQLNNWQHFINTSNNKE